MNLATSIKNKATNMFTSALNSVNEYGGAARTSFNDARSKGQLGKMAGDIGAVATNTMGRHKNITAGAAIGAGYGMASDDTSVVGGAIGGGAMAGAAAVGYGLSKPKFAGLMNKFRS